jgi:hypothetical protein
MIKLWIPIALVLFLTACAGVNPTARIDLACESASSAVLVLTTLKAQGELTVYQTAQVSRAVDVIDPICGAEVRPTTTTALDAVNRALLVLNGVRFGG